MTADLRVAVVGFGWMGQVHTRAWARLLHHYPESGVRPRLVAVADPDAGRREHAVTAYGFVAAYADWHELLERDDLDVVSVCGPNFVHRETGTAVAESGRHLWIEKPAGRDAEDTAAIAAAVRKAGVFTAVGFNYRNAPAVEVARDLVASGALGRIETVDVRMLADYSAHPDGALTWRFDPEYAGTGVLGDLASHGFDLARYVGGDRVGPIRELVADRATFITERPVATGAVSHFARGGGRREPVGNEDHAAAMLRFESGALGSLTASRVAVGEQCSYGIEVRGTEGALGWDFCRMGELRTCLGQDFQDAAWQTRLVGPGDGELGRFQPGAGIAMGYDDLKVVEAARLAESIGSGTQHGAGIDDAVVAAELVAAMVRSAEEGRWVRP